jgi:hypothetical protein
MQQCRSVITRRDEGEFRGIAFWMLGGGWRGEAKAATLLDPPGTKEET